MIKVMAFRYYSHLGGKLPEMQLEEYLENRFIRRGQIISVTSCGREGTETLFPLLRRMGVIDE